MLYNIQSSYGADIGTFISDCYRRGKGLVRTELSLKNDKLEEFLGQAAVKVHDSRTTDRYVVCEYQNVELLINLKKCVTCCYVEHADLVNFIDKFGSFFEDLGDACVVIKYFYKDNYGIQQQDMSLRPSDINNVIPELYPDIDIVRLCEEYMTSKDSILFLTGDPGVGKTSFIKYLLRTLLEKSGHRINVAYVKDVEVLQASEAWVDLRSEAYDLLILDDLDFVLATRTPEDPKSSIVNNLLSYSDGVLVKSGKMVITSNMEVKDIDPALMRPGRCFDFLELNALSQSEAQTIWNGRLGVAGPLPEKLVDKDKITQAELMSLFFEQQSMTMKRTYYKRQTACRTKISAASNRLGFGRVA